MPTAASVAFKTPASTRLGGWRSGTSGTKAHPLPAGADPKLVLRA